MADSIFSIIGFLILGIITGILSIAFPGFHTNTISSIISSIGITPALAAFCIMGVLAARPVFEILLSVFFGIPDESTAVSPLPGQALFLEGRGFEAVMICAFSAASATLVSAALSPLAIAIYPLLYAAAKPYLAVAICVVVLAYALFQFKSWHALAASLAVFAVSGYCGYVFLEGGTLPDPLFAIFAGLFSPSWLLFSAAGAKHKSKAHVVQQITYPDFSLAKYVLAGVIIAFISLLFPSVSSPVFLAGLVSPLFAGIAPEAFLAMIYSISFSLVVFSFSLAASIGRSRVGAIEIASSLVNYDPAMIIAMFCAYLAALAISVWIFMAVSRRLSGAISRLENEAGLKYMVAGLLVFFIFLENGVSGVAVFGITFIVGCLPFLMGTPRVWLMGSLILPTLYYLMS
ncbi:MAG: tripartite tricarboxylate transporter permease [Candidatus Micrarchaeia archaeon]